MKKMKRLVSVLVAGIMVLAMLTACGGGGTGTSAIGKQVEDEFMKAFNSLRSEENGKLENDSDLSDKALAALKTIDAEGNITKKNAQQVADVQYDVEAKKVTMTVISVLTEDPEDPDATVLVAKEVKPDDIAGLLPGEAGAMDAVSKVGVATIERNGKTYVAAAMTLTQAAE